MLSTKQVIDLELRVLHSLAVKNKPIFQIDEFECVEKKSAVQNLSAYAHASMCVRMRTQALRMRAY